MKTDPILREVWATKGRLAAEAGYDAGRFLEQLRVWTAAHPHDGPVIRNAADGRRLAAQRAPAADLALKDEPPSLPASFAAAPKPD
jgi:hypothetical protein